jgi:PGF-pre-PGF domain-containing protein
MRERLTRAAVLGMVAVLLLSAAGAGVGSAQTGQVVTLDSQSTLTVGSTDGDAALVATNVQDGDGVGSYEIELQYNDSALDLSVSSTSRFDIQTNRTTSGDTVTVTIVGYTSETTGSTGDITLTEVDVSGESPNSGTTVSVSVEEISDTDGDLLPHSGQDKDITVNPSSDTTDPIADAGSDQTVQPNTDFQFDGSASTDADTGIDTYEWDVDDDGTYELSGPMPTHNYSSTGTRTVTLRVTDFAGNTATDTVTVNVQSGGGGGPTGPGGGGGGGGDGDDPDVTAVPDTPQPVSATVDLDETGSATVDLSGGTGATSVSVNVPDTTGQVNVQELPSPPTDVPAPTGQYVSGVDIDAPDPPEGQTATVTLTISQSRLDDLGVTADDLVIQHYTDGAWQELETTATESGNQVTLSAPVTGFSPFAVTTREQVTTTAPPETTTAPPGTTTTSDTTTSLTDTPQESDGLGFLPVIVVIVALLAAAGYLIYRQQD